MSTTVTESKPATEAQATRKWTSQAGPRQTKAVNDALRNLQARGQSHTELTGVIGGQEHRSTFQSLFGGISDACRLVWREIGERYDYTITGDNYRPIVADLEAATATLEIPVIDKRITQEEHRANDQARKKREAKEAEQRCQVAESHATINARKPKWADCYIVAELDENQSDSMSDYFAHSTSRTVVIGWRRGKREDFRQLRAAAGRFEQTAHLGPDCDVFYLTVTDKEDGISRYIGEDGGIAVGGRRVEFHTEAAARAFIEHNQIWNATIERESIEHRENYSMGSGNYLKAGSTHSSGWKVRSVNSLPNRVCELVIPDASEPATGDTQAAATDGYQIEKHRHTKRGFDMWIVVLADRVERDMFERLRDSCEQAGGWYSRQWGRTPGGFAFKEEATAQTWAAAVLTSNLAECDSAARRITADDFDLANNRSL